MAVTEAWRTPFASSPTVALKMSRQRRRDTPPELALRKELHRHGLRYFTHRRPLPNLRRQADVVFPRVRVAVFVDGCFWHGCPEHGVRPTTNNWYWQEKIARNGARDTDTDRRLTEGGWMAIRVWEHESTTQAATRVIATVTERRIQGRPYRRSAD